MPKLPTHVTKYVNKFSSDFWKVTPKQKNLYKMIIVIPAISEQKNIKNLSCTPKKNQN